MNKINKYLDMKINRKFYKGNFYEDLILDLVCTIKHPYASIRVLTNDLNRLIKNAYYNIENEKIIEIKLKNMTIEYTLFIMFYLMVKKRKLY